MIHGLRFLPLLAAFSLVLAAPAQAREMDGRFAIGIGLGPNIPTGSFGDFWEVGGVGDLSGEYYVSDLVSFGLLLQGTDHKPKDEFEDPDVDVKANVFGFVPYGRFSFPGTAVQPYVSAGAGAYRVELEFRDPNEPIVVTVKNEESNFGLMGGAGLLVPLSRKVDLSAEGAFHNVFVDEGDDLNFVNVKVGARLLLGGGR